MQPKSNIIHLPVYKPGKSTDEVKKEFGLEKIIKLASNENPYGFSEKVKQALMSEFENTNIYPDGASTKLTDKLSEFYNVPSDQLIFGAGSDEVILMIARAFLVKGDETIMATHTFPQYKHNAEIEGAVCIEVPLKDGTHDLDEMLAKITNRTKIIWVCCPNNPTGTINSHDEVKAFLEQVPNHVLVVFDEAYAEYNEQNEYPDSLSLMKQFKNLVVLRTFSKIYGLASLRIGYGIAHPEIIHTINQVREPFNTTRYAQSAALAAIEDQEFIKDCREKNKLGLAYLKGQFERLGLSSYPAYGNFVMVDVQKPAELVFQGLLQKGIIIRGGHQLGFPTSLRVTIGSQEQNEEFINVLESVLNEIND
ncbi:histidinol-phosphate transaminase [Chengkuizengella axinellae]|uniref:Histidinol-phosphate aminotransferase n=1 Tax=Chengkuizengella axinellae TaxID=3064388 RepID=A0ABT9IWS0_9BACL|nr:histidinol-phosphate transaminase [Chengkuizengella sp. 2205SS18-9]MDP5273814.1 histidinol-phosphate transaminase [Chengkuizengella sp. 2205SS18-9]